MQRYQAIVVGAGFYGVSVALYLAQQRGLRDVLLLEREAGPLQRASYRNQARVHGGFHYPRSFTTAFRSRINLPRFLHDFHDATRRDFHKLYAIARHDSKVSASQFRRFCREIGAALQPASVEHTKLFDARRIEAVFEVQECAFDADRLRNWAQRSLADAGIDVRYGASATGVASGTDGLHLRMRRDDQETSAVAPLLFNCCYSGLTGFGASAAPLKHELTELVLVEPPAALRELGITVMDGPFFSLMPFPARGLHSFSHVRYTPHRQWPDQPGQDAYAELALAVPESRFDRMRRDAERFMPSLADLRAVESLYEVKTLLPRNEIDDGRPILFETSSDLPGLYSILGGKIDNIYDVLERLDAEPLHAQR